MNASILRGYNVVELITDQQAYASISMWLYHFHFSGQLTCGSQPTVPMCVVCSLCHSRLSPEKNLLWFFLGRGGCDTGYVVWSYIGLLILFLPDGYAMLMRLNKAKTAVHGCQCLCGMAVCMRKVLARPCECVSCFLLSCTYLIESTLFISMIICTDRSLFDTLNKIDILIDTRSTFRLILGGHLNDTWSTVG